VHGADIVTALWGNYGNIQGECPSVLYGNSQMPVHEAAAAAGSIRHVTPYLADRVITSCPAGVHPSVRQSVLCAKYLTQSVLRERRSSVCTTGSVAYGTVHTVK